MTEKERADAGTTSFRAGRTLPTSDRSTTLRCWMAPRCTTSCERGCTRHELSKELSLGSLDVEEPHSYKHVTCCQLHDASKLFSDSSVALAVVSVLLSRGSLEFGVEAVPILGVQTSISLSCHTCSSCSCHFTDTDGTVTLTTPSLYISMATTLLIDCLYSLQTRDDHVWSCCGYSRSHRS